MPDQEGVADRMTQSPSVPTSPVLPPINSMPAGDMEGVVLTSEAGPGSEGSGTSFSPVPTSSAIHPSDELPDSWREFSVAQRREIVADGCQLDPDYAKSVLAQLPVQAVGWCELVQLEPTKAGGYVQLSYGGANKFAMLQQVVLWADGKELTEAGHQCSHRCHNPKCRVVGHVTPESAADNNSRKNCLVWIDCHHCDKKIFVCMHSPCCIKFCEGPSNMESLLATGVCRNLRVELHK